MNKIVILADSTCDLSKNIIKEREIEIIPLKVCFEEEIYKDLIEIDSKKIFELAEQKNMVPKTSAPTCDEFKEIFKKAVDEGNDVISISISSEMSSSYQQSILAASDLGKEYQDHIFCIDSRNLSSGIGLLVLKACDMRDEGLSAKYIKESLDKMVSNVRAQFSVKDLEYLHKGGRCSGTSKFFGTLLRIHPILRVLDGKIILSEKIFGRYSQCLDLQIKDVLDNLDEIDNNYLFITHSDGQEEVDYILEKLPEKIKKHFKHIYEILCGCVIASHCGPHTMGLLYISKNKVLK